MALAENERPALIEPVMIVAKAQRPVSGVKCQKLNRRFVILRLRPRLLGDPPSAPVQLKAAPTKTFLFHGNLVKISLALCKHRRPCGSTFKFKVTVSLSSSCTVF